MTEPKGLNRPEKLNADMAAFCGETMLSRTKITKALWAHVKANQLQTKSANGKPENAGKFIVADAKLLTVFKNTHSTSKAGKLTDLRELKEGETIGMMQMAAVVSAGIVPQNHAS